MNAEQWTSRRCACGTVPWFFFVNSPVNRSVSVLFLRTCTSFWEITTSLLLIKRWKQYRSSEKKCEEIRTNTFVPVSHVTVTVPVCLSAPSWSECDRSAYGIGLPLLIGSVVMASAGSPAFSAAVVLLKFSRNSSKPIVWVNWLQKVWAPFNRLKTFCQSARSGYRALTREEDKWWFLPQWGRAL